MAFYAVGDVARRCNCPPKILSDLFYLRKLDPARCPIVSGRRLIPDDYLPAIEAMLRDLGYIKTPGAVA
jgi:hypothetical protein